MKYIILLMVSICQYATGQNYIGDQADIEKILTNVQNFSEYVMGSNYEKIADSYTEDAKIFPNNSEILEGRELIKAYWMLPEGVSTSYHKITPSEIKVIGTDAYDYGHYEGKTIRQNGEEVSWKGKYVIIWKKVDDDWKMYLDIWNRIKD